MSSTQEVGALFGEGDGPAQSLLRSPTVIIFGIGLWGMNIFFFRLFKLDYIRILNLDLVKEREAAGGGGSGHYADAEKSSEEGETNPAKEQESPSLSNLSAIPFGSRITWGKCVALSFFLLIVLEMSEVIWVDWNKGSSIGAIFFFYGAVATAIAIPLSSTRWIRIGITIVLQRTMELINPRCACLLRRVPRPIPFIDVFYADAMCSMSKVFFDWGMLSHLAYHYPDPVPKALDFILIPSACAAVPYFIRAHQCLIMYAVGCHKKDPKRIQHVLNAIKYASSIIPLCISAYQQTLEAEQAASLERILVASLIINSSYALTWDIVMDWGMFQDPTVVAQYACGTEARVPQSCGHTFMRSKLRFGVMASGSIAMTDTILRYSWLLRFHEGLFPSKDHFVLFTQLLEAFRRGLWNLLRVEWESIKHARAARLAEDDDDEIAPLFKPPPSFQMSPMSPHSNGSERSA